MKTAAERQAEAREKKLDDIRQQVDSGALVIRRMTDDERKQFPPATDAGSEGSKRRRGAARRTHR